MLNFVQVQASGPWGLRPGGEGENFNHRNTLSILRIKLKLHCVQNVELDTEIGQKGAFYKGFRLCSEWVRPVPADMRFTSPALITPRFPMLSSSVISQPE